MAFNFSFFKRFRFLLLISYVTTVIYIKISYLKQCLILHYPIFYLKTFAKTPLFRIDTKKRIFIFLSYLQNNKRFGGIMYNRVNLTKPKSSI